MDWIEAFKSNPDKAVTLIYDQYRAEAINWIVKDYKMNREDAEEIFQTSIVLLFENFITGKLIEFTSGIKTYLFAIIKNKIIHHNRLKSKFSNYEISNLLKDSIVEDYIEINESDLNLSLFALEKLGHPCKSILEYSFYQQKNIEEITSLMEYKNTDTTKNLKYKCIKRLQKLFFELKEK